MKKLKNLSLSLVLALLLFSCSPAYIPCKVNAPEFSEAGDLHVDMSVGFSGGDIQGGLAITDNIGIAANFNSGKYKSETIFNETKEIHNRSFELEGVVYYPLSKNIFISGLIGVGRGKINNLEYSVNDADTITNAFYNKIFIQPYFYIKTSIINFNLGMKLNYLNMNTDNDYRNLFYEPYLEISLGYKYIKPNFQLGFSVPASVPDYNYNPFIFNLGVLINFDIFN